jgi:hypothetical protein
MNVKTFSLRAEMGEDVQQFYERTIATNPPIFTSYSVPLFFADGRTSGEVAVEIRTTLSLEDLRNILRAQIDSHVMLQTLRELPLSQNQCERDYSIS